MRVLLLNDSYFLDGLRERLDKDVFFASPAPEADLSIGIKPVQVQDILRLCPFRPDVILLSDSINVRIAYLGLENLDIPKVFYAVDSPMNSFWQLDFAQAFDMAFFDQKAQVDELRKINPRRKDYYHWLPLAADTRIYRKLDLDKIYDISFIGLLNHLNRPKRTWILDELKRNFNLHIFDGGGNRSLMPHEVVEIYNRSKIVLNQNLFPGLNLRTFEVMASGACLLAEDNDRSWRFFFKDWKHLVTYKPETLVERVSVLLENEQLRDKIAHDGWSLVCDQHSIDNRVDDLLTKIRSTLIDQKGKPEERNYFYLGKSFLQLSNRWPQQPVGKLKNEGVRLLMSQLEDGEKIADIHYELGVNALEEGRPDDALASFEQALQIDPAHLRTCWGLFWCHRELDNHTEAYRGLERFSHHLRFEEANPVIAREVSAGLPFTAVHYVFFGRLLEKAGWLMDAGIDRVGGHPCRWSAFDAYQKAINADTTSWQSMLQCAALLDQFGTPEFAVMLFEQAARIRPWDASLNFAVGDYMLRSYRRQEGLMQLVHYLMKFTDSDKWEKIEKLAFSDVEWQLLLDHVLDSCREADVSQGRLKIETEIRNRILSRAPKSDSPGDTKHL
jgi:tetratricopeptide (TPR) repeat protein